MWPCLDPDLNKKWNEKVQNEKRYSWDNIKHVKLNWVSDDPEELLCLCFEELTFFLEIHGWGGNMIGVLELALTYLPTRKGEKRERANRSYNFAPPSYKQPMHPNPSPLKHSATLKTQAFPKTFSNMSHTRCWLLVALPIGITYSQINHLTFLQHHKIYTFAPA